MNKLDIDIEKFSFVDRERRGGKTVIYRCGRDFMYYTLHFYLPDRFNKEDCNPVCIENNRLLGFKLPWFFMWTFLNFCKLPKFLLKQGLSLHINQKNIRSFPSFIINILFSRISYNSAISLIERGVDGNTAVGVDISMGFWGIFDHVMFVYGYDDKNLYVFDTHKVPGLEYEQIEEGRFVMKLPRSIIKKRWSLLSRVWLINKL